MSRDRIDVVGVNSGIYVVVPSWSYFNMECNQQCVWMSMMKIMFIICFRMANEKKKPFIFILQIDCNCQDQPVLKIIIVKILHVIHVFIWFKHFSYCEWL